ncbi:hemolysin III family protein [Bacillus aquiflavi]|uniref:Hemolysin III family protein n=1 Tax=Bacillus aquiflavi TaxID=2672567 RepID=A0A6B3VYQ5_9BACI|nr:hemolysin III family protein [Bacillus aquiflavi]MBA4537776.1 hemolysin III family protein [Bacillus aquiflavi]NEY82032.1 hemolysin III family protein [Bacillus aquiflavi]UAC46958.1 hemolysin III family protein [Bacillus aquiflavi]
MTYTIREEVANAITHGIGFLLSIPAFVLLIIFSLKTNDPWYVVSFTVFGGSMILLYLFSTLTHSIQHRKAKYVFEILDHAAIYILIAGTYTPFVLIPLRGGLGWILFGVIWTLAIAGIVFKMFFVKKFIILSTLIYIMMGWLVIIAIKPLYEALGTSGFTLLLTGGILYTIGSLFYVWRKIPYHHAIWHIFVLAGSSFMYFCILLYV